MPRRGPGYCAGRGHHRRLAKAFQPVGAFERGNARRFAPAPHRVDLLHLTAGDFVAGRAARPGGECLGLGQADKTVAHAPTCSSAGSGPMTACSAARTAKSKVSGWRVLCRGAARATSAARAALHGADPVPQSVPDRRHGAPPPAPEQSGAWVDRCPGARAMASSDACSGHRDRRPARRDRARPPGSRG
jgi:hypothetical protein